MPQDLPAPPNPTEEPDRWQEWVGYTLWAIHKQTTETNGSIKQHKRDCAKHRANLLTKINNNRVALASITGGLTVVAILARLLGFL